MPENPGVKRWWKIQEHNSMWQRKEDTLKSSETNTNTPQPYKNQITLKSVKILSFLLEKKETKLNHSILK